MPIERYANAARTTLSGALGIGDTAVTVVDATAFPGAAQFRLRIDDELMLVTAVSGTTFTVTRGAENTTIAAHAAGATVTLVITAASLIRAGETLWTPESGLRLVEKSHTARFEDLTIAAGATATLLNATGPGHLSNLFITIRSTDALARERSLLQVSIDGEASPSISAEIGLFCAAGGPPSTFATRYMGCQNDSANTHMGYYSYLTIPFSSSIQIDITNGSASASCDVWAVATYHTGVARDWGRYARLGVESHRVNVPAYIDQDLLNVAGRGVLWGTHLFLDSGDANWNMLEGNIQMFVDGEANASLIWPGTEDYAQNPFFFSGGVWQSDFGGTTIRDGTNFKAAFYRLHVLDPVPFETGLQITWTNGDSAVSTVTNAASLASLVWYYLDQ